MHESSTSGDATIQDQLPSTMHRLCHGLSRHLHCRTNNGKVNRLNRCNMRGRSHVVQVRVNAIAVVPRMHSRAEDNLGLGLYPRAALLNHSCAPNVSSYFSGRTLHVRALTAMAPGTTLRLCYGPQVRARQVRSGVTLGQRLLRHAGFQCEAQTGGAERGCNRGHLSLRSWVRRSERSGASSCGKRTSSDAAAQPAALPTVTGGMQSWSG